MMLKRYIIEVCTSVELIGFFGIFIVVIQFLVQMKRAAEEERLARQIKRYEDFKRMLEVSCRSAAA